MKQPIQLCAIVFVLTSQLVLVAGAQAHPGSGIAVDAQGTVYFTDTGKGLWKLPPGGTVELVSATSLHFMGLDATGAFANSRPVFGRWFERATPKGVVPAIIECSDFPMTIGPDGNIYYADTMEDPTVIKRRTPAGEESVVAILTAENDGGPRKYVTGMAAAPDGAIYVLESDPQNDYVLIRKVDLDGTLSRVAFNFVPDNLDFESRPTIAPSAIPEGEPVPMGVRSYSRGLFIDRDGTIYVAANGCQRVLAIDTGGTVREILHSDPPYSPTDVSVANGEVYVLEYDHTGEDRKFWTPRIRKVDANGKVTTLVAVTRE